MKKALAIILVLIMVSCLVACSGASDSNSSSSEPEISATEKPQTAAAENTPASTAKDDEYPITGNIVYFKDTLGWGANNHSIYVHYWNSTGVEMVKWPGNKMTSLGNGVYSYDVPEDAEFLIFNMFGDSMSKAGQTRDIPYDGSIRKFQASKRQDKMQASYVEDWDGNEIGSNQIDDGSGYNQMIVNTSKLVTLESNDDFEVKITNYDLETSNKGVTFKLNVKNNSNSTLSKISFFFLAYNENKHARIIDVGKKAEVGWEDDAYIQEFSTESGFTLKPGETKDFALDAAKKTISGYQAIVSSYTTSDGKETYNSNAYEWYKNAYTNKVVDNSAIFNRFSSLSENIDGLTKDDRGAITLDATVLFDVDSSTISQKGKDSLKKVIDAFVKTISAPDGTILINKITVEGHTDPDGTHEYNQKLSEDRANAVKGYCVQLHSELKDVMVTKGCADDNPVKKSDGSVDKAASRRVCFVAE